MKTNLLKSLFLSAIVLCLLFVSACKGKPAEKQNTPDTHQPQSQTDTEAKEKETETNSDSSEDTADIIPSETEKSSENGIIEKINCAADETGIYTTVIALNDKAADKGTVEMVYCGPKGTPQENSVVNTFRIEYYKTDAGTFEIHTFYDGEVYQNYHNQAKVKITNTFGATVRAGNVTVFYTPDGKEKSEIYKADAENFIKN